MYFVSVVSVFQVHGIVFHGLQGHLSWSTSSPSFSLDLGVPSLVSNSFLTLPPPLSSWYLLVFLGYVSTWLLGSALTCSGSIVKLLGTISVWHRTVLSLFPRVFKSTWASWIGNVTKLSASWYLFAGYRDFFTLLKGLFVTYCSCLDNVTYWILCLEAVCIYGVTQLLRESYFLILRINPGISKVMGLFLEKIPPLSWLTRFFNLLNRCCLHLLHVTSTWNRDTLHDFYCRQMVRFVWKS